MNILKITLATIFIVWASPTSGQAQTLEQLNHEECAQYARIGQTVQELRQRGVSDASILASTVTTNPKIIRTVNAVLDTEVSVSPLTIYTIVYGVCRENQ